MHACMQTAFSVFYSYNQGKFAGSIAINRLVHYVTKTVSVITIYIASLLNRASADRTTNL